MKRRLALAAQVALPVLGFALRYRAHPAHAFDPETAIAATAGRAMAHGMQPHLAHFQVNLHQGSQLVDALLAAVGFEALGDHTLAWGGVGLLWVGLLALAGADLLRRVAGPGAAWAFAALLTVAPYALKDGFVALSGGHPPVAVWMLLALAAALRGRGLLAGLLLGVGTWYTRSVVLAAPVVLLALAPGWCGGRLRDEVRHLFTNRRLLAAGVGLLAFPALLLGQLALHRASDTWLSLEHQFLRKSINPIVAMDGCTQLALESGGCSDQQSVLALRAEKTAEALGLRLARLLWAQPTPRTTGQPDPPGLDQDAAGVLWVLLWSLGLLGVPWAVARGRLPREALLPWGLTVSYLAGYAGSSMRIEEASGGAWPVVWSAPPPTKLRYLMPLWSLLLVVLAAWLGTRRAWARGLLALLLLSGAGLLARDVLVEAEPPQVFARHRAFRYLRAFEHHRGPPREAHRLCGPQDDPISRANHLRALAGWSPCDVGCLGEDPAAAEDALDALADEAACDGLLRPGDRAFLAHGLGIVLGSSEHAFPDGVRGVIELGWSVGVALPRADGDPFLRGVLDALRQSGYAWGWDEQQRRLCRATPWGSRPLCPLVGLRMCESQGALPNDPADLCTNLDAPSLDAMDPAVRRAFLAGAGEALGRRVPLQALEPLDLPWSPPDRAAFVEGWRVGQRFLWRDDDAPYTPLRMP